MHLLYCTSHVRTYVYHAQYTVCVCIYVWNTCALVHAYIWCVSMYMHMCVSMCVCVHVCMHVFAPIHFRLVCIHMYVCTYILLVLLHVHINVCSLTMSTYVHATGSISTYTHLISWNDTQLPRLIGYESVNYFVNSLY